MAVLLAACSAFASEECVLKNGPMTIFRTGTEDKIQALGKENYAQAVRLYAACPSVPSGTRLGIVDGGFPSSTVVVRSGTYVGCMGDLPNEFLSCK